MRCKKGAFKSFSHQHLFEKISEEKTQLIDIFEYESPLGILGKLADKLFLKSYMKRFLLERNQVIKTTAESDIIKSIFPLNKIFKSLSGWHQLIFACILFPDLHKFDLHRLVQQFYLDSSPIIDRPYILRPPNRAK